MRVILTPDDLKRGELADPGWYMAVITDYEEKPAETDQSTNGIFHFKILAEGPFKGIPCQRLFNEKAMGFGKNLWKTLAFPKDESDNYVLTTELLKSAIGSKLKIYLKRGKSNKGNDYNDVADFMPI